MSHWPIEDQLDREAAARRRARRRRGHPIDPRQVAIEHPVSAQLGAGRSDLLAQAEEAEWFEIAEAEDARREENLPVVAGAGQGSALVPSVSLGPTEEEPAEEAPESADQEASPADNAEELDWVTPADEEVASGESQQPDGEVTAKRTLWPTPWRPR